MADLNSGRPSAETFHVVRDPKQAKLLSDPKSFAYLEPFIAQTLTVTAAADKVGCNVDTMLYRVRTFLQADLLRIAHEEKRAGRPVKHYRSCSDAYFVPFDATPYAELEERLFEMRRANSEMMVPATARLLREVGWEGQRIYRDPKGEIWRESALDRGETAIRFDDPRFPVGRQFASELYLSDEDAKALQHELDEVRQRYSERSVWGSQKHPKYGLEVAFLKLEP